MAKYFYASATSILKNSKRKEEFIKMQNSNYYKTTREPKAPGLIFHFAQSLVHKLDLLYRLLSVDPQKIKIASVEHSEAVDLN